MGWLRGPVLALLLALCGAPAFAQCVPTQDVLAPLLPEQVAAGDTRRDALGRVVAPVMINGRGPFNFIVDTGANRSVLSQALIDELGIAPSGSGDVHSVHDVTTTPLVDLQSFTYGRLDFPVRALPVLQGPVLAGQQGILGVDGLAGRLLKLDFRRHCIEITPPRRSPRMPGWTTLPGRLRFGGLIVLPGRIRGVDVNILVDTGSDSTLANVALRTALRARSRPNTQALDFARAYSAGEPVVLDSAIALPELDMGEVQVSDVLAFVGDFHIFELWGLQDEPTLLMGMDVLRRTQAIAIDYERALVHFRIQRVEPRNTATRLRR